VLEVLVQAITLNFLKEDNLFQLVCAFLQRNPPGLGTGGFVSLIIIIADVTAQLAGATKGRHGNNQHRADSFILHATVKSRVELVWCAGSGNHGR
jgi:hypothetical protein